MTALHVTSRHRGGVPGVVLLAALALAPRSGGAVGRDIDWEEIFQRAQDQFDALEAQECVPVALNADPTPENREIAADSLQVAAVFDFVVRNFPDRVSGRADKVATLVEQAVKSYERAFTCAPSHEARRTLEAAIALVHVALQDLEPRPAAVRDKYRVEYQGHLDRLEKRLPVGKRPCPSPRKVQCEAPPELEKRRGCAVANDGPGTAVALVLLALGTWWRGRRPTTPPSPRGRARGA